MIPRYSHPEMAAVWSEDNRLRQWLEVEILVCEARAEWGEIPGEAARNIRARADFSLERVQTLEAETRHDVVAFVKNVGEHLGPDECYLHQGLTSSDILDTGLALQVRTAGAIIQGHLDRLQEVLRQQALRHRDTVMVGRTHGVHAEPISLGLKFLLWMDEACRSRERLDQALENMRVGKISGAVGTYASIQPRVEEYVCSRLGLKPDLVSTQVVQRDRHAQLVCTLALVAASLEKAAVEIRHLQRTEVRELQEPFARGQRGSSAMPHKQNPIACENVSGLARLLRGHAVAALENVALWHERDISHSSVERVILPDSFLALDHMLRSLHRVLEGLVVHEGNMRRNLDLTRGLIHSQRVLLALTAAGMSREEAYTLVQKLALEAWADEADFRQLVRQNQEIGGYLDGPQLEELFDVASYLVHQDTIYQRFGLTAERQD